jgi:hypothetical protein
MKRLAAVAVLVAAACSGGGGSDKVTGPAPVASVSLSTASASLQVGETTTLTATPKDASGNALTGRTVSFSSSNTAVASVTAAGTLTGVAVGGATITATVESKTATVTVAVVATGANCSGVTPVSVALAEVRTLSGTQRSTLCIAGGASGSEYVLIPVNTSVTRLTSTFGVVATNTATATGQPTATLSSADASGLTALLRPRSTPFVASLASVEGFMPRNIGFERNLRARERELWRSVASARRSARGLRPSFSVSGAGTGGPSTITGLATSPTIGSLVTLNANGLAGCSSPINRPSRVVAISNSAIVVEDTTAPAGGFSAAEYASIAATFDTLVYSLDTTAFGAPYDMDHNGKVILFFTTAVNQLTPAGSGSVIGGFFFERDMVPRVANQQVPFACAASNEGEMFYLPVVDANSRYNAYFRSKSTLLVEINGTTIHEFQHLINASRRYYVTPEIVESEESWLNEGMSHIAEEILYMHVAGLGQRQHLNFLTSTGGISTDPKWQAMVNYQSDNLDRYNSYVQSPESNSPLGETIDDDALPVRGGAWGLIRWALDHSAPAGGDRTYLKSLVDAPTQGPPNFDRAFSGIGGLVAALKGYAVANFADGSGIGVSTTYQQLSWNFREWLPHFTSNNSRYPLQVRPLANGAQYNLTLAGGGSSFLRFRVNAGATGAIAVTIGGAAPAAATELLLLRTQ